MKSDLIVNNEVFKGVTRSKVTVLDIKDHSLHKIADFEVKKKLFDYLDNIRNRSEISILIITMSPLKSEYAAHIELFRKRHGTGSGRNCRIFGRRTEHFTECLNMAKFCNAMNQLIIKIVKFNKFVIHAGSGVIISPFMNLSLACDYRIVAENSCYKNLYLDFGLVPKGGSAVLLSRLIGFQKAYRILLSNESISANEAQKLGIVDEVVPAEKLFDRALKVGKSYAELPPSSISGIKKLMNLPIKDLENCLKSENEQIFRISNSAIFIEKLEKYNADWN